MNKTLNITTIALFFSLFIIANAYSATYYVGKKGCSDSGSGSINQPFCTITKGYSSAFAGDTVYIRAGTYTERLSFTKSGTSCQRITISGYKDEAVTIQAAETSFDHYVIRISGAYNTLKNITNVMLTTPKRGDNAATHIILEGDHNLLDNIDVIYSQSPLVTYVKNRYFITAVRLYGRCNTVKNCRFEKIPLFVVSMHGYHNTAKNNYAKEYAGNCFTLESTKGILSGNLIESNYCEGSTTSDAIQAQADWNLPTDAAREIDTGTRGYIIRNNILYNQAENCIDMKATSDILIEGNIMSGGTGNNDGGYTGSGWPGCVCSEDQMSTNCHPPCDNRAGGLGGIMRGSYRTTDHVIIRGNIIYDNNGGSQVFQNWVYYNNLIMNNARDYSGPNANYGVEKGVKYKEGQVGLSVGTYAYGSSIKNNFIGYNRHGEILTDGSGSYEIDYNAYPLSASFTRSLGVNSPSGYVALTFKQWKSYLNTLSGVAGKDAHSVSVTPGFVNVPEKPYGPQTKYNFSLTSGSGLIDKGGPLTYTSGSGSGTTLRVLNSKYFFDGFKVMQGDLIKVGNSHPVRITGVNYDTNTITLASRIHWDTNVPLYFCKTSDCYKGSAPDIGPFEYGAKTNIDATIGNADNSDTTDSTNLIDCLKSASVTAPVF